MKVGLSFEFSRERLKSAWKQQLQTCLAVSFETRRGLSVCLEMNAWWFEREDECLESERIKKESKILNNSAVD